MSAAAAAVDEPGEWIAQHAGAGAVTKRAALGGSDWASFARYDTGIKAIGYLGSCSLLTPLAHAQQAGLAFS